MESRGRGRATKETIRFGGGVIEREREKRKSGSFGTLEECAKRKRENSEEGGKRRERVELFKKNTTKHRLPGGVESRGGRNDRKVERGNGGGGEGVKGYEGLER